MTLNSSIIHTPYRGRFAPSPSGDLHFGSLVAAVGSYLEARTNQGEWLLRIEDLDPPRVVPGAVDSILRTLENHQLHWDQTVVFQSDRREHYDEVTVQLRESGVLFACQCSRSRLKGEPVYPGTCRNKALLHKNHAIRLNTAAQQTDNLAQIITMNDQWQGRQRWNMEDEVGDFVIQRADGFYAYQLAVVVDDFLQKITHVIRGSDLLESTPRQIYLQHQLDYPVPQYGHLPIATDKGGKKLSKQNLAEPLNQQATVANLFRTLEFLGQNPPQSLQAGSLKTVWQWAMAYWKSSQVPHKNSMPVVNQEPVREFGR